MAEKQELVLMVGGSGTGKSTVRVRLFGDRPVVDCDQIKSSHPDYDPAHPEHLHAWSSEKAARQAMNFLAEGTGFVYDSTGTNLERLTLFAAMAHAAGMSVRAVLVVCPLALAMRRCAQRPRRVPPAIFTAKHQAVLASWPVIKSLADHWQVIDNEGEVPFSLAYGPIETERA